MRIMETKVCTFDELDEQAKERAREWYRESCMHDDWWDLVYDDAKQVGALFGVTIERIYFRGFWSQGDGACFEGSYEYKAGGLAAVREYCPSDTEVHAIAQALQDVQRRAFYGIYAHVKQSGHYMHSGCTAIDVRLDARCVTAAEEQEIKDQLRLFMDWIYSALEREYEYQTSDEMVDEGLIANEYEFTESGELA